MSRYFPQAKKVYTKWLGSSPFYEIKTENRKNSTLNMRLGMDPKCTARSLTPKVYLSQSSLTERRNAAQNFRKIPIVCVIKFPREHIRE